MKHFLQILLVALVPLYGQHFPNSSEEKNVVGRIELGKEGINQSTWIYVKSALDEFRELDVNFVILNLNTPGGEVFAAQQISDALKELDTQHGIPVVAFIDNWAISAGAMLAYSCRYIATVKDGAMGAAEPIMQQGQEVKTASEKVNSALRADFANRAGYFDRNPLIAMAMVDKDMVLVQRKGEIVQLPSDEEINRSKDRVITTEGKLLTLTAKEMIELGVADYMVPPAPMPWEDGSLLFTISPFKEIPNVQIIDHKLDWKTRFFAFLANPVVGSILFLGMMLGFYMEFNTPGFGLPGIVGLVCLFFIILASFSLEAAGWLEVIFLVVGLGLIALEVFVLPGFGVAGILGIIISVGAILLLLVPGLKDIDFSFETGDFNAAAEVVLERLAYLGAAVIVGVVIMIFLSRYVLPKVKHFSKIILTGEQEGYIGTPDVSEFPEVGTQGVARTPLRPAGKVKIEDAVYDAVSVGSYIDAGAAVEVIRYDGSRMVVKSIDVVS